MSAAFPTIRLTYAAETVESDKARFNELITAALEHGKVAATIANEERVSVEQVARLMEHFDADSLALALALPEVRIPLEEKGKGPEKLEKALAVAAHAMGDVPCLLEGDAEIDDDDRRSSCWFSWLVTRDQALAAKDSLKAKTKGDNPERIKKRSACTTSLLNGTILPVGYLSVWAAISGGCYGWLADRAGTPKAPAEWVERSLLLAAWGLLMEALRIEKRDLEIDSRRLPGQVKVHEVRRGLAERGIITTPRELLMTRIVALPALVRTLASEKIKIVRKNKGFDYEISLGSPEHARSKQLSIFGSASDDTVADPGILPFIMEDLQRGVGSPYCLDFFFSILTAITNNILSLNRSDGHERRVHVTWEQIAEIMNWDRPHSTTIRVRHDLQEMCTYLQTHPLIIRGSSEEGNYRGPIFDIHMGTNKGDGRAKSEIFREAYFTLSPPFAEAIFAQGTKRQAALVNAANIFDGGGIRIEARSQAKRNQQRIQYQMLSLAVDTRSREAMTKVGPDRGFVLLHIDEIALECGISDQTSGSSSGAKSMARRRRRDAITQGFTRMVDKGHIRGFEVLGDVYRIAVGTLMEDALITLLKSEQTAAIERKGGQPKRIG